MPENKRCLRQRERETGSNKPNQPLQEPADSPFAIQATSLCNCFKDSGEALLNATPYSMPQWHPYGLF